MTCHPGRAIVVPALGDGIRPFLNSLSAVSGDESDRALLSNLASSSRFEIVGPGDALVCQSARPFTSLAQSPARRGLNGGAPALRAIGPNKRRCQSKLFEYESAASP